MKLNISRDMLSDISRDRNEGASWAAISRAYGIPVRTLKNAYLRKSEEVYGGQVKCENVLHSSGAHQEDGATCINAWMAS